MNFFSLMGSLNREQRSTFLASFLGWMLDAFDFFLVTFVTLRISKDFSVVLPLLRVLFGIAMGGEWGLGSSLAMESLPTESRGLFSGILQQGYACGYLVAAIVYYVIFTFFPSLGWRAMFVVGVLPALLVVYIRYGVHESPVWEHQQVLHRERGTNVWQGMGNAIKRHWLLFVYLIILMTAFNALSHGTQDNLPTFLQAQLKLPVSSTSLITIIANIGAIIGGTLFGFYSQRWGRRRAIIIAAILGIIMIPFWIGFIRIPGFSLLASIATGAFLLQFMVQGAWGIIPVHLNELSPTDVRGTFPGFAYQLGNLFAAEIVFLEAVLAQNLGSVKTPNYASALAIFSFGAFLAVIIFAAIGREAKGIEFIKANEDESTVGAMATTGGS